MAKGKRRYTRSHPQRPDSVKSEMKREITMATMDIQRIIRNYYM